MDRYDVPRSINKSVREAICHLLKMDNIPTEIADELRRNPIPLERATYFGRSKIVDCGNAELVKIQIQYDVSIQYPHKYKLTHPWLGVTHDSIAEPPHRVIGGRLPLLNRYVDISCTSSFEDAPVVGAAVYLVCNEENMVALKVVLRPQVRQNLKDFDEGWMRNLVNWLLQAPLPAIFCEHKLARSIALTICIMSWHGDGFPREWSPEATRDANNGIEVRKASGEEFKSQKELQKWIDKGKYYAGFTICCTKRAFLEMRLKF